MQASARCNYNTSRSADPAGPSPRCQAYQAPRRHCSARCSSQQQTGPSREAGDPEAVVPLAQQHQPLHLAGWEQQQKAWKEAQAATGEAGRRLLLRGTLLLIGAALGFTPGGRPVKAAGVSDNDDRLRSIMAPPPVPGWGAPLSKELVKEQDDPVQFSYPWASDLPQNLKVREYNALIKKLRPGCWKSISQQIATGKYSALSVSLTAAPFADIRQAALMLPWALMQRDEFAAAVDARKAYNGFNAHVMDMQTVALAVAAGDAKPEQLQQAFILMSASLDQLLASVPIRWTTEGYMRNPQKD